MTFTCSICLCVNSSETIHTLQCTHTFHSACIQTWLADNNTCPMCREVIYPLSESMISSRPLYNPMIEWREQLVYHPNAKRYATSGYVEILPCQDDIMYHPEVENFVIGNMLLNAQWMMIWQFEYYDVYSKYVNIMFWKNHQEYHNLYDEEYQDAYDSLQIEMESFDNRRREQERTGMLAMLDNIMRTIENRQPAQFRPTAIHSGITLNYDGL